MDGYRFTFQDTSAFLVSALRSANQNHRKATAIPPDGSLATSASLLQRARSQDPDAWRLLCQIYAPLVYGWVRKRGVSLHEAPDVVQDVFRVVAGHLGRFRSDRPGDTFRGWLATITQTEVRVFFRRRSKQPQGDGGTTAALRMQQIPDGCETESGCDVEIDPLGDRGLVIRRAAEVVKNDFAPHTWQAFWRSVVDGESPDVIAADLNMTTNAIRQARFRVLNRLREILADSECFGPDESQ